MHYTLDIIFSSELREKEGVLAWGFSKDDGAPPWKQDVHWMKGQIKPPVPQQINLGSQVWFNICDFAYDGVKNKTQLLSVVVAFQAKDPSNPEQTPLKDGKGKSVNPLIWDSLIPQDPYNERWISMGTGYPGGLWVLGTAQLLDQDGYFANNPGRFSSTITLTVKMPDGSVKTFSQDPEMDVISSGDDSDMQGQ